MRVLVIKIRSNLRPVVSELRTSLVRRFDRHLVFSDPIGIPYVYAYSDTPSFSKLCWSWITSSARGPSRLAVCLLCKATSTDNSHHGRCEIDTHNTDIGKTRTGDHSFDSMLARISFWTIEPLGIRGYQCADRHGQSNPTLQRQYSSVRMRACGISNGTHWKLYRARLFRKVCRRPCGHRRALDSSSNGQAL